MTETQRKNRRDEGNSCDMEREGSMEVEGGRMLQGPTNMKWRAIAKTAEATRISTPAVACAHGKLSDLTII